MLPLTITTFLGEQPERLAFVFIFSYSFGLKILPLPTHNAVPIRLLLHALTSWATYSVMWLRRLVGA